MTTGTITAPREEMTLEQVRDWHRSEASKFRRISKGVHDKKVPLRLAEEADERADAIDAHLTRATPRQVSDEDVERSCSESYVKFLKNSGLADTRSLRVGFNSGYALRALESLSHHAAKVLDEMELDYSDTSEQTAYANGWNAYRKTMLAAAPECKEKV